MGRRKAVKFAVTGKEGQKVASITIRPSTASNSVVAKVQEVSKARAFWNSLHNPRQTDPSRNETKPTNNKNRLAAQKGVRGGNDAPKKLQRPSKPDRNSSTSSWGIDFNSKNKSNQSQRSKNNSSWYAPVAKRSQNDHSLHYTQINDNRKGVFIGGPKTQEGHGGQKVGNTRKEAGGSGVSSVVGSAATAASCVVM